MNKICLNEKPKISYKRSAYENIIQLDYSVKENCSRDQVVWRIDKILNPYELYVVSDSKNDISNFSLNIFGTDNFDIYEILGNGYGQQVTQINKQTFIDVDDQKFDFPEITFVNQPLTFHQIKKQSKLRVKP